jgi:hypothetical protein
MKTHATVVGTLFIALLLTGACGDPPSYETANTPNTPAPATAPPAAAVRIELVEEGFLGQYNIVHAGTRYYAIPQNEGAFDAGKAERGDYDRMFAAGDPNRVKTMARDGVNAGFGPSSTMLVEEGYKGSFNIIRHNGEYYGMTQGDGAFDPGKISKSGYRGASLREVKQRIQ